MNVISVPVLPIYEFFCDPILVEEFHNDVFSHEIKWFDIGLNNTAIDIGTEVKRPAQFGKLVTQEFFFNKHFFNWLQECVDKVAEIHLVSSKLSICDYWITKSIFGEKSTLHNHRFSLFSGVYYFSDQEKSVTKFTHNYLSSDEYKFVLKAREMPVTTISVTPQKGKLLIFPSFLAHEFIMKDKNVRHTFAFNTFVEGVVSSLPTSELELKVIKNVVSL